LFANLRRLGRDRLNLPNGVAERKTNPRRSAVHERAGLVNFGGPLHAWNSFSCGPRPRASTKSQRVVTPIAKASSTAATFSERTCSRKTIPTTYAHSDNPVWFHERAGGYRKRKSGLSGIYSFVSGPVRGERRAYHSTATRKTASSCLRIGADRGYGDTAAQLQIINAFRCEPC